MKASNSIKKWIKNLNSGPGAVAQAGNPTLWDAEVGGLLEPGVQPVWAT